ncbi:MarR family winged helix-turn-helix transcriptional regulator [Pseudothauera rhizosphaerae]|uniref:MarR family transcriptional regulator n=1 Tax=Pseudothauera rhizosphaerae TaxID=2565932 RepID=A0A4S4AIR6_9RHOO|nr:MarR family transcriptional regulator [Pseudothauera rhizosphaerae]THF59257.1 MarR family transcriptional regulator [Pseudothauera rhizosphaerae]
MKDLSTEKNLASIEINNRLFFRFFQAANTLHTKGTQALDAFGVTTQQWSVLGALSRPKAAGGMSVGELSRYLLVSRQNLYGLLTRLERDGYVEHAAGEEDRRSRKVRLTPKGEALWAALADPIHTFYDQALKGLSFDDRLAFIHYINLLQRNMSQLQGPADPSATAETPPASGGR